MTEGATTKRKGLKLSLDHINVLGSWTAAAAAGVSAMIALYALSSYREATLYSQRLGVCADVVGGSHQLNDMEGIAENMLQSGERTDIHDLVAGSVAQLAQLNGSVVRLSLFDPEMSQIADRIVDVHAEWFRAASRPAPDYRTLEATRQRLVSPMSELIVECRVR